MTLNPVLPIAVLVVLAIVLIGLAIAGLVRASRSGIPPRGRLVWALRIVMVLLVVVIALRPAIPGSSRGPSASGGLEVYFAVDTTSSMAAEDYLGTQPRLEGVKADIAAIAERLTGAQFSLVTFDSSATQRVPLTTDATALQSAASVMTQEVTDYSRGSSVDEAVPLLDTILTAAKKKSPGDKRVLFYLGDGEQTTGSEPGSFAKLAPLLSGGGVLGYGTSAGGRMLAFDGYVAHTGKLGYIQDSTVSPPTDALSRIDETELRTIASQLGVRYTHRTATGSVESLVAGLDVGRLSVSPGKPGGPLELYWIFAIPLGLLVVLELVRLSTAVAELRPAKGEKP